MRTMVYDLSPAGLDFLKAWERFASTAYNDGYGYMTIGYGHVIKSGESFGTITEQQASDLLYQDVTPHIRAVNTALTVDQTQPQFDALVSFDYNTGAFPSSTLCQVINANGQPDAVRAQFMRWINAAGQPSQGLVNRRTAECNVYFDGNYVRT
jgi:lysozyme